MQRHFRTNPFQRLHLEVCVSHPTFNGSKGVLNRFSSLAHLLGVLIKTLLNGLKNMFVLPTGNPALFACGAFIFNRAALAGIGPVAV